MQPAYRQNGVAAWLVDRLVVKSDIGTRLADSLEQCLKLADGMAIGRHHVFISTERANQHQQRRFRKVKVGNQRIDGAKLIARFDEDARLAGKRFECAVTGSGLQAAYHRSADCHDSPAACARRTSASAAILVST